MATCWRTPIACAWGGSAWAPGWEPGYSELWVEDDGPGVPAEQRARIIRRGERADTQHPGQGIGLAVALDIIESYDGELSLDDSELGGACFRIRFATV